MSRMNKCSEPRTVMMPAIRNGENPTTASNPAASRAYSGSTPQVYDTCRPTAIENPVTAGRLLCAGMPLPDSIR